MDSAITAPEQPVTVRYWAALKSAAETDSDLVTLPAPVSLAQVLAEVERRHSSRPRFADVLGCCSVLLDSRPVGTSPPQEVVVPPGSTVELLPPFAGG